MKIGLKLYRLTGNEPGTKMTCGDMTGYTDDFLVADIIGTLKHLNCAEGVTIMRIISYEGSMEEKEKGIKDIVEMASLMDTWQTPYIVCTDAYISKDEYPESKYVLKSKYGLGQHTVDAEGREPINVKKALYPYTLMLDGLGFVNTNFYTQYEFKESFIYPATVGKLIINHWKKLVEEKDK